MPLLHVTPIVCFCLASHACVWCITRRVIHLRHIVCVLSESSGVVYGCFCFNDPATTDIYTLSLHDALPICDDEQSDISPCLLPFGACGFSNTHTEMRSEEHTSELQSHSEIVCRLLLEKKK